MRRLILLLSVLAVTGCWDNSGTEPIVSLNGIWDGFLGNQELTMGLGDSNGVVTGTASIVTPGSGSKGFTVSGTYQKGTIGKLNVTLTNAFSASISFVADVDLLSMTGTLNGSGYNGTVVTLARK